MMEEKIISPQAKFEKYLKMRIVKVEDGYARVYMPYCEEFTNPHGFLHGGAIVSLADTAMAVAIFSGYPRSSFYTVKLEVKFKSPAQSGVFAEAKIIQKRKKFVFGKVKVKDNQDKLLAEVQATFYLIK